MQQKRGFAPILVLVIVLILGGIIFVTTGSYISFDPRPTPKSIVKLEQNNSENPWANDLEPVETTIPETSGIYKKMLIDIKSKFAGAELYPLEITSLIEETLNGMDCSQIYEGGPNMEYTFTDLDENNRTVYATLQNEAIIKFINTENNILKNEKRDGPRETENGKAIDKISYCRTENGRIIVVYGISHTGGGAGSDSYFGFLQNDSTLKPKIEILQSNMAYYRCYQPITLTSNNLLYYQCGGGDGPSGESSIFRLDLDKDTVISIRTCISGAVEKQNDQWEPYSKCE